VSDAVLILRFLELPEQYNISLNRTAGILTQTHCHTRYQQQLHVLEVGVGGVVAAL
jgi:hypothetical protein